MCVCLLLNAYVCVCLLPVDLKGISMVRIDKKGQDYNSSTIIILAFLIYLVNVLPCTSISAINSWKGQNHKALIVVWNFNSLMFSTIIC